MRKLMFLVLVFLFSACGNVVTKKHVIDATDSDTANDDNTQTDNDTTGSDENNDLENPDLTTDDVADQEPDFDAITDEENDNTADEDQADNEPVDNDSVSDPRIDLTGPDFTGSTVLILNGSPDGETSASSGTFTNPFLTVKNTPLSNSGHLLRNDLRPPLPKGLKAPLIIDSSVKKSLPPVPKFVKGDKDTIYVYDFGTGKEVGMPSTLQYVGTHIEIWKADDVNVSAQDMQSIANEFDNEVYGLVTENFYSEADIDENGKVSIILANLGGFAAGYFNPADYYTKEEYPNSNHRDLIYIESSMGNAEIFSTMTHEFQHLVHSNKNILIEDDWNSGELPYRYIDEGLATAAQHMYEGLQEEMVYIINDSGYNQSIGEGNSFIYWDYSDDMKVYSDYAMAYVFFQYLRIRAGNDTTIYNEIIECTSNDYTCVEAAITSRVDSDYTFTDFLLDFRIALILQDKSGPYGFNNENGFSFTMPYFGGTSVSLRGGGGVYISSNGNFVKPSNAGNSLIFAGIND